jgi:UMF1 family MFS transporter
VTPTATPDQPDAVQRRREQRAWYFYDWANSAYVTTTLTALFGPYLTVVAKRDACPGLSTDLPCPVDLQVLGVPISPGSIAAYAITAATLLSAVLLPVVGAVADRSDKRRLLAAFAWVGASRRRACSVRAVPGARGGTGDDRQPGAGLLAGGVRRDPLPDRDARRADRVSSRGWAIGYLGGGLLLALNLAMVTAHEAFGLDKETAVRVSLLSAGLWWGAFTLVPFFGLLDRPATDPDPAAGHGVVGASFGQLRRTLAHLRGYPQTGLFLLAYLFFNDGVQTVIYAASIFGQEELGFDASQLMVTVLLVQFVAFFGALAFGWAAGRVGAWRAVLGSLVLWCLVVAAGYVVPDGRFGLFLVLAAMIGIVLGGTQALSRSLFSQLVPRGREAEYFSLYQAAERGTSWLGTLLFGLLFQLSGSYRTSIVALVVFFVLGGVLLSKVDVPGGIRQAGNEVPQIV